MWAIQQYDIEFESTLNNPTYFNKTIAITQLRVAS